MQCSVALAMLNTHIRSDLQCDFLICNDAVLPYMIFACLAQVIITSIHPGSLTNPSSCVTTVSTCMTTHQNISDMAWMVTTGDLEMEQQREAKWAQWRAEKGS